MQIGWKRNTEKYPQYNLQEYKLGPVIAAHLGSGGMGLGFTGRNSVYHKY